VRYTSNSKINSEFEAREWNDFHIFSRWLTAR
jgi:hypothetical protein